MIDLATLCSFEDFRKAARRRLPRILFDYIDGGSYDERTLSRNAQAFQSMELVPRVMMDVSAPDSRFSLFGKHYSLPLILGPVGFAGMYAKRGEVQTARAAHAASIPFCLSTVSLCSIEEVALGAGAPPWFQLYMIKDRGVMAELLQRASRAECPVLVLTADLQTPGARYRDIRSGMMRTPTSADWMRRSIEMLVKLPWFGSVYLGGRPHSFGNLKTALPKAGSFHDAWAWIGSNFDPSITWDDLDFIRQHWSGPILLKGVMHEDDAQRAVREGVDGIIVSNHGGRQLDGAPASLDVLPKIRKLVPPSKPLLCDSGVRSGLDILRAQTLGADGVLVGKAWAFALAAGGEAGVSRMIEVFREEYRVAQTLTAELNPTSLKEKDRTP